MWRLDAGFPKRHRQRMAQRLEFSHSHSRRREPPSEYLKLTQGAGTLWSALALAMKTARHHYCPLKLPGLGSVGGEMLKSRGGVPPVIPSFLCLPKNLLLPFPAAQKKIKPARFFSKLHTWLMSNFAVEFPGERACFSNCLFNSSSYFGEENQE